MEPGALAESANGSGELFAGMLAIPRRSWTWVVVTYLFGRAATVHPMWASTSCLRSSFEIGSDDRLGRSLLRPLRFASRSDAGLSFVWISCSTSWTMTSTLQSSTTCASTRESGCSSSHGEETPLGSSCHGYASRCLEANPAHTASAMHSPILSKSRRHCLLQLPAPADTKSIDRWEQALTGFGTGGLLQWPYTGAHMQARPERFTFSSGSKGEPPPPCRTASPSSQENLTVESGRSWVPIACRANAPVGGRFTLLNSSGWPPGRSLASVAFPSRRAARPAPFPFRPGLAARRTVQLRKCPARGFLRWRSAGGRNDSGR